MTNRRPDPIWRSLMFVPVNVERFVAKAGTRGADGLILDLEDSIAPGDKDSARALIPATIQRLRKESRGDILVRINQPLELAVRDLEAAVQPDVAAIMVTKAEGPEHLRLLDELVCRLEAKRGLPDGGIRFIALVESPAAVLQAYAIAKATPRTVAMSLGAEDYATAVGGKPSEDLLLMPKQQILQAARAAGILPMGTIGTLADFSDIPGLRAHGAPLGGVRLRGLVGDPSDAGAGAQQGLQPVARGSRRGRKDGRARRQGAGRGQGLLPDRRQDDRHPRRRPRQGVAGPRRRDQGADRAEVGLSAPGLSATGEYAGRPDMLV